MFRYSLLVAALVAGLLLPFTTFAQISTPPQDIDALEHCPAVDSEGRVSDSYDTLVTLALISLNRNLPEEAIGLFTCAILAEPDRAEAFHGRGQAYAQRLEYARAVENYDAAAVRDPLNVAVYIHRSRAFYAQARFVEAARDASRALALHPNDARAYHVRGLARFALHQLDLARADFDRAIALGHDPLTAPLFNRARLYITQGQDAAAAADYERILALDAAYLPAYRRLADTYIRLGRDSDAQRVLAALEAQTNPIVRPVISTSSLPPAARRVRALPLLVIGLALVGGAAFTLWHTMSLVRLLWARR